MENVNVKNKLRLPLDKFHLQVAGFKIKIQTNI